MPRRARCSSSGRRTKADGAPQAPAVSRDSDAGAGQPAIVVTQPAQRTTASMVPPSPQRTVAAAAGARRAELDGRAADVESQPLRRTCAAASLPADVGSGHVTGRVVERLERGLLARGEAVGDERLAPRLDDLEVAAERRRRRHRRDRPPGAVAERERDRRRPRRASRARRSRRRRTDLDRARVRRPSHAAAARLAASARAASLHAGSGTAGGRARRARAGPSQPSHGQLRQRRRGRVRASRTPLMSPAPGETASSERRIPRSTASTR